jgi:hypothetical protein
LLKSVSSVVKRNLEINKLEVGMSDYLKPEIQINSVMG